MRNAFNAFESPEKKGVILTSDLTTIIEMLGHRLDDQKQKQAIREADPAGKGELEFEQFAVYASRYVEVEEDLEAVAKELREAFLLYDREGMCQKISSNLKKFYCKSININMDTIFMNN